MTAPARVAVEVGSSAVRIALAAEAGAAPVVVEREAGPPLAALLGELVALPVPELVVVHPPGRPVRPAEWAPLAVAVRAVPAPVAAAVGFGAGRGAAVLDVGASRSTATLLDARGRVMACRTVPVGGDRLDRAVAGLLDGGAAPRAVREALSLLPTRAGVSAEAVQDVTAPVLGAAVEALRDVLGGRRLPVLLTGGVARAPLLAELADAAGIAEVAVAERPEAAAVLGALVVADRPEPAVVATPTAEPRRRLPGPVRRGRLRAGLAALLVGALTAGLAVVGAGLGPAPAAVTGTLVQYGYRVDVPQGWEHTGGQPGRRRTLLTPVGAPGSSDLVAVELSPLGYDAGAEPERAAAELRAVYDAGGPGLSGYDAGAELAGRPVTAYRQVEEHTAVDWYVRFEGTAQLSVGCRHTPAGAARVRAACEVVVGSLHLS